MLFGRRDEEVLEVNIKHSPTIQPVDHAWSECLIIRELPIEYGNIRTNSGWGRQKNWNPTVAPILLHPLSNYIYQTPYIFTNSYTCLLFYEHEQPWQELYGQQGTESPTNCDATITTLVVATV